MTKVLVTEPVHENGLTLLKENGFTLIPKWELSEAELATHYDSIEAIFVRIGTLTAEFMAKMPNLKVVSKHGVGCDTIDVAYARANDITVAIASDGNAPSVAEHTLMMMLNCAKTPYHMDSVVRGDYSTRTSIKAFDIGARCVFVFGYGRIGVRVAALCKAFGMRVIIADEKFSPETKQQDGFEIIHNLDEGLAQADFLTLHVPLTDKTHHLFTKERLLKMPKGGFVINCARGGIVDEGAVRELTKAGHLGGAGFDVFSVEPIVADNPLLEAERCWLSPHTAAFTAESLERMSTQAAQNIVDRFAGGVPTRNIYALEVYSPDHI
jgi:D-3-phosphoglycerate dehydrogenase